MNSRVDIPTSFVEPDDLDNNPSANAHFTEVLDQGLQRRGLLRGGMAGALGAIFAPVALTACGGGDDDVQLSPVAPAPAPQALGFSAVARTTADKSTVPAGYTARTLFACGDPMAAGVPAYKNDGTDTNYDQRSGDCHDGIQYFGLNAAGARDDNSSSRALLGINHEYITPVVLHANGPSARPRPASETDIEVACHGVSIVEVAKGTNGEFAYVQNSSFNRRITGTSVFELSGPARGNALFVTKFSPTGTQTRGTMNNCGNGKTPWGTLLTTEENWSGYYFRAAGDQALRSAKVNASFARYGRNVTATAAAASRYGWETSGTDDKYARWNTSVVGTSTDGSDDYRHEWFCQGFMVEIDPYSPTSTLKKRTGLGRFAHENAAFGKPVVGKPLAVYMGCDSQNEYVYKWVSTALWDAADANRTDRMAVGDKYLDAGKLYVARFNTDGSGQWLELNVSNAAIAGASFGFSNQAEIYIHTRIAADAVGATKMDRPEWVDVHPTTGEIYVTMTNNSSRRVVPTGTQTKVDAANPRAYVDVVNGTGTQSGNVNGHIVRFKDAAPEATTFTWDVYLFASEASADPRLVNLSGLTDDNDLSSPDGLAFTKSNGLCWIQTDDGAYTDVTNCMVLAAVPGVVGDGAEMTLNYGGGNTVTTRMGKKQTAQTMKRFYVGPADCEVTGLCETPDGKTLFMCIQHPGDGTAAADLADPTKYTSQWPSNEGYGAGKRPRSATIVITKNDGGMVGFG
ncbi:PhoX family protein [Rubrivivax rivuli]|uniref:PhoX family phosphatase n=1 Tax=Rubrivivax rivuli TaxID=1862385 RepID=A0A437RHX8_9BURK|nr:PhoX family phosphatase [Rubrivivax rivuli]RVU46382.1 PhoX family phosphatase [Rubrivivax rivuli]